MLHLGWSIDPARVREWAHTEGFDRYMQDINGCTIFDEDGTTEVVLAWFARRAYTGTGAELRPRVKYTCHRSEPYVICVASTGEGTSSSTLLGSRDPAVVSLGKILGAEGILLRGDVRDFKARWYVDYKKWCWTPCLPPAGSRFVFCSLLDGADCYLSSEL